MTKIPTMISTTDFVKKIDEIVKMNSVNYIDAVVDYCYKNGIEVETAAAIIKSSPTIKSKIQLEAENLNVLEKSARLPIDD